MNGEKSSLTDVQQAIENLPEDKLGKLLDRFVVMAGPEIESAISKLLPSAIENALRKAGYSEEVAGLLHLLAARSNDSKESVLEKALTLYGLALDAREKGNRLAIISPDDMIVHDVVGFEPDEMEVQKVAS